MRGCEKMRRRSIEVFETRSRVLGNLAQSFRAGLLGVGRLFPNSLQFNGFLRKPLNCKELGGARSRCQYPALKDWARFNKAPEGASILTRTSLDIFSRPLSERLPEPSEAGRILGQPLAHARGSGSPPSD